MCVLILMGWTTCIMALDGVGDLNTTDYTLQ